MTERSWRDPDVRIVHFGSPEGTTYGSHSKVVVEEFLEKHPDFEIAETS